MDRIPKFAGAGASLLTCQDSTFKLNAHPSANKSILSRGHSSGQCLLLWKVFFISFSEGLHVSQEERVEQLRSFSFLSGVVAGFAIAALLQLQIEVEQTEQCCQIWFATSAGICVRPWQKTNENKISSSRLIPMIFKDPPDSQNCQRPLGLLQNTEHLQVLHRAYRDQLCEKFNSVERASKLQGMTMTDLLQAACSLCAMVMCSLILISIVKRSRALISEEAEARYVDRCLEFAHKWVIYNLAFKPWKARLPLHISNWEAACRKRLSIFTWWFGRHNPRIKHWPLTPPYFDLCFGKTCKKQVAGEWLYLIPISVISWSSCRASKLLTS